MHLRHAAITLLLRRTRLVPSLWEESGRLALQRKINVLRIEERIVSRFPVFWNRKLVDPGAFVRWFINDSLSVSVYYYKLSWGEADKLTAYYRADLVVLQSPTLTCLNKEYNFW